MSWKIKNGANVGYTQAEIDAMTPSVGDILYNTTSNELQAYNGSSWDNAGGGGTASPSTEYYAFNTLTRFDSENVNDVGLDMDSIPTNFLTNNGNWFVAIRLATVSSRDDSAQAFVTGDASGQGFGWYPNGTYFAINSSSSYLQSCDIDTPANSFIWVIFQRNGSSKIDAWVDTVQEINQRSVFSLSSTQPTSVSFLRPLYSSAYLYNFVGSISNILIGNGNVLTQTEVDLLTGDVYQWSDIDSSVQTLVTHAWSFDATSVVNDKGTINLTPTVLGDGAYEFIKQSYNAPIPYLTDGSITVNNDTTGDFDLSSVLVNRGGVTVSYSKVSGDAWFGVPDTNTGILTVDANGQTAGDYTAVYRVTDPDGNTDDMTLTATVTALVTIFEEDWESGIGSWTVVDDAASVNQWELGTATFESGSNSMYVSDDGGTSNSYNTSDTAVAHVYHEFTTPSDISGGVTLDFSWKGQGESSYDYLRVFVAPTTVTPTGGTEVSSTYNIAGPTGKYNLSSSWNNESVDISSLVAASTTYRLIFQWKNDSSGGTQPPSAIDNISIVA